MRKFFEAYVYFMENGLGEKLAKELAEKLTGVKAPTGKIEIPKTKGPEVFQMPKAADDVIEASDNVSGNYAAGDTKYNADILAEELARKRGFIEDDGIQNSDDMSDIVYSTLYSEAYEFLSNLNRLNKPVKRVETPKKLVTKKQRGDLNFINSKISNPLNSKFILQGLDGTTESLYTVLRTERDFIKKEIARQLKFAEENNMALGEIDKDNLLYNSKIYNDLNKKVIELETNLSDQNKNPVQIYEDYKNTFAKKTLGFKAEDIKEDSIFKESMDKLQKLINEMNVIKSGKKQDMERDQRKLKFQGKGYGPSEGMYRTLVRQFLRDEIEAGRIETIPSIYNAMKTGGHPIIDPIKVFRHHYGDDKFDVLENYISQNYPVFDSPGIKYPGRFEFRKIGLVPINKKAPGNTYEHYSLPDEIDQEIREIDGVIENIQAGKNPLYKNKDEIVQGILEQNSRRANFVKVKNEITPKSEIDLTQYTNEDLNKLADEGNELKSQLSLVDEDGSSTLPYQEFQEKAARLEQIEKIIEEAKNMPEEFFDQQLPGEIIPFPKKNGKDGFARGGIVEVLI